MWTSQAHGHANPAQDPGTRTSQRPSSDRDAGRSHLRSGESIRPPTAATTRLEPATSTAHTTSPKPRGTQPHRQSGESLHHDRHPRPPSQCGSATPPSTNRANRTGPTPARAPRRTVQANTQTTATAKPAKPPPCRHTSIKQPHGPIPARNPGQPTRRTPQTTTARPRQVTTVVPRRHQATPRHTTPGTPPPAAPSRRTPKPPPWRHTDVRQPRGPTRHGGTPHRPARRNAFTPPRRPKALRGGVGLGWIRLRCCARRGRCVR